MNAEYDSKKLYQMTLESMSTFKTHYIDNFLLPDEVNDVLTEGVDDIIDGELNRGIINNTVHQSTRLMKDCVYKLVWYIKNCISEAEYEISYQPSLDIDDTFKKTMSAVNALNNTASIIETLVDTERTITSDDLDTMEATLKTLIRKDVLYKDEHQSSITIRPIISVLSIVKLLEKILDDVRTDYINELTDDDTEWVWRRNNIIISLCATIQHAFQTIIANTSLGFNNHENKI